MKLLLLSALFSLGLSVSAQAERLRLGPLIPEHTALDVNQKLFERIDSDGDEVITRKEARDHVKTTGEKFFAKIAKQFIDDYDVNQDKVVSRSEFRSEGIEDTLDPLPEPSAELHRGL
jgi:hypothetical protein